MLELKRWALPAPNGGDLVEVTGAAFEHDGVQYKPVIQRVWSDAELVALGLVPVQSAEVPFGHRKTGRSLALVDGLAVETLTLEEIPIAELRMELFLAIGALRWARETGGIVFNGIALATDDRGQAKHTGAVVGFREDPERDVVEWKLGPGEFETIHREPGLAQGVAVLRFVQDCFSCESALARAIHAAPDAAALAAIDITAGWPATIINGED